jgi:hypothetical protein
MDVKVDSSLTTQQLVPCSDTVGKAKAFSDLYLKSDFKTIPSEIHTVWVGSQPGRQQQEYLRQWAEKNPGSTINLWVDSLQFDTFSTNKAVREKIGGLFSDPQQYQAEKLFRGLFSQLNSTLGKPETFQNEWAKRQALKDINIELSAKCNESFKQKLLSNKNEVTAVNANEVSKSFRRLTQDNDEKYLLADRLVLDQTIRSWDCLAGTKSRDVSSLKKLQDLFFDAKNIRIRDLSNPSDIQLQNRSAYNHEVIGRNGAYPAASDIARYEILYNYGGVYADIGLECLQPLAGSLESHPDLMVVGLRVNKKDADGNVIPYFSNALLASHAKSEMLAEFIQKIGKKYQCLKGNEFDGDRYFSRPNRSTIDLTGPNALRHHVDTFVHQAQEQSDLVRNDAFSLAEAIWGKADPENKVFWGAVESHMTLPEGYVNFETEEQQLSATYAMANSN